MAFVDDLKTRRDAIGAELAAGETPNGQSFRQPTLSLDGETVDTDGYVDRLYRELDRLNEQIDRAEGGFILDETRIVT